MPAPTLTPNQRIAKVSWMLGQGYGLSEQQIRTLGHLHSREQVRRMLAVMGQVACLSCDDDGMWSWDCRGLTTPETWRRDKKWQRRHDPHERARAAWVAFTLAKCGEVTTRELSTRFAISRQAAFRLLDVLSIVLPLYIANRTRGVWAVLDMKELEQ